MRSHRDDGRKKVICNQTDDFYNSIPLKKRTYREIELPPKTTGTVEALQLVILPS